MELDLNICKLEKSLGSKAPRKKAGAERIKTKSRTKTLTIQLGVPNMNKLQLLLLTACLMAECLMAQSPGSNYSRINSDRSANRADISILGATPSVVTGNVFVTANSSSTTITNFTGGVDNQSITVICGDANTTIANNRNIVTASGKNITCTRNLMNVFVYSGANAQWVQALMRGTSGGSIPGGSNLRLQLKGSGSFPGTNDVQMTFRGVKLFVPPESATFCGPEPWSDVICYGWYAQYSSTTGTINGASNSLTLGNAQHFLNGEYLVVYGAGAAPIVTTPTGVSVTPSVNAGGTVATLPSLAGSTSYAYEVVAEGLNNDYSAASTVASTATGQASLGPQTATIASQSLSNQTVTVTCATACALPTSTGTHIYIVFNSTKGAPQFEGDYIATGVDSTHFTYQQGNFDSRNGAPTSSTGGTVWWWNTNHITWSAVIGAKAYHVYGPSCPGTCNWIGESVRLAFDDYGTTANSNLSVISGFPAGSNYMEYGNTRPPWMPSAAPSSSGNQMLSCKIGSGGGTSTLTLVTPTGANCNAGASVVAATTLSDDGPPLVLAQRNGIINNLALLTSGAVFIPGNMTSGVSTYSGVINSYTDLSSANTTFYLDGVTLLVNNTISLGGSTFATWSANGGNPQFGWGSQAGLLTSGSAYPLLRMGGGASISHMNVTCGAVNGCLLMDFIAGGALFHTDNSYFGTGSGSGGDYTGQIQLIHSANFSYHYGPNVTMSCGQMGNPASYNDQSLDPLICNTLTNNNGGGAGSTTWGFSLTGPIWTLFRAGFDQDWSGAVATGTNIILANNIWTQSMSVPLFMDTSIPASGSLCGGVHLTNIYEADRSEPMYAALAGACNVYMNTVFNGVGNHPIVTGNDIAGLEVHNISPPLAKGMGDSLSFGYGSVLDGTRCNNSSNCLSYTELAGLNGELALNPTSNIFVTNLPPPAPTCTSSTTGGRLSNGTYYFYFAPVYPTGGEGVPSPQLSCAISGGTSTQLITLNWTATNTAGAIGYNVYYNKGLGIGRLNGSIIPAGTHTTKFTGVGVNDSAPSSPAAGPTQMSASGISAPTGIFYNSLRIGDQGSCTMTTGSCTAQKLSHTYTNVPNCIATWNGAGMLTGLLKVFTTTTTVIPASSVSTDTAVVNWVCFGN
jgi:hypothetical protein